MDRKNHILIGWPNRGSAAVLTGGSWRSELPVSNMTKREPWAVARSASLSQIATRFDADLSAVRNLRCIALGNHNLSRTARWRVQLGSEPGIADLYDSAWQAVWAMSFGTDALDWESVSFWEGVVDAPDENQGHPFLAVHVLPDWLNARYMRVLIDDPANAKGYVDIGQFFCSGGWQPEYSASYGLKDSWTDATAITKSESGYAFADARRRRRSVQFETPRLSHDEAAIAHELQRRQGIWGQVLWVPYPANQAKNQRYGFIGRMAELSPIDYPMFGVRSTGWSIEEI